MMMMMRAFAVHVCTPNIHFLLSLFIFVMYNGTLKKNKKNKKTKNFQSQSIFVFGLFHCCVQQKIKNRTANSADPNAHTELSLLDLPFLLKNLFWPAGRKRCS